LFVGYMTVRSRRIFIPEDADLDADRAVEVQTFARRKSEQGLGNTCTATSPSCTQHSFKVQRHTSAAEFMHHDNRPNTAWQDSKYDF
jgi:hypothetical protein